MAGQSVTISFGYDLVILFVAAVFDKICLAIKRGSERI